MKIIKQYESELRALPPEELQKLYEAEAKKYRNELADQAAEKERNRYFNHPSANADFDHWSKTTYWTLEEAVALSFGKDPEQVNWNELKNYSRHEHSPFIEQYRKVRDLALRAKNFNQLYDPILPGLFIAWARRIKIEVPKELIQKIEDQGILIADWKDMYDKLKEQYDALQESHTSVTQELENAKSNEGHPSTVTQSPYWRNLENLAEKAIRDYPIWKLSQRKIQKTGNLQYWLVNDIGCDNREAEILKRVLSEIFNELN